jgi:DNA-binding NtrC family response regulator
MKATDKVLIIDDELDICYLVSSMLKQRNLRPSFVNTLADATTALQAEMPSLLFLDNHLPDGFGLDFIPFIKSNYPEVKIIMITAHDGVTERTTAYRHGVDFFIAKPLTRKLINDAVDKLLDSAPAENPVRQTTGSQD